MSGPAFGQASASSDASDYNATQFLIDAAAAGMQTASVARVVAVHGGGVASTGTVDIQIVVNLVTGNNTAVPHGTIYGVPFARAQSGTSAIICDPVAGDLGLVAFASRDISSVVSVRGTANPGSSRMFDWADAIYVGGMLNGAPTTYLQFNSDGSVTLVSPTAVTIQAPQVTVNSPAVTLGSVTTIDGVVFLGHTHISETPGSPTGPVIV